MCLSIVSACFCCEYLLGERECLHSEQVRSGQVRRGVNSLSFLVKSYGRMNVSEGKGGRRRRRGDEGRACRWSMVNGRTGERGGGRKGL